MTPPRSDLSDTGKELVAAVEEAARRAHETPTPLTMDAVELKISQKCETCQRPGGALHTLVEKLEGLTAKVETALLELAGRRGEKRVWAIWRMVAVPVSCVILGFVLNHLAEKRSEEAVKKQSEIAEKVAKQLLVDQTRAAQPQPGPVYK